MARFKAKEIPPNKALRYLRMMGAATTREIKTYFETDSKSVRRVMAKLMLEDKVFPMPWPNRPRPALFWMPVTGERGLPNPIRAREEAE